jgi:hypothetical protein
MKLIPAVARSTVAPLQLAAADEKSVGVHAGQVRLEELGFALKSWARDRSASLSLQITPSQPKSPALHSALLGPRADGWAVPICVAWGLCGRSR